ncbi:MAG: hypothetical protein FJ271_13605 [Planctomycetes bacterium]|nr:hypothetical protein [Planctomycetota bacterium]
MFRLTAVAVLAGCVWTLVSAEAVAEKKKVLITMKWNGSVADEELRKTAPECITSYKGLEKIWKAWKIKGTAPKLDFSEVMVVAVYSSGSRLSFADPTLDEKGNLQVVGFGTRDLRPGFRYVLGTVSKAGVVTVNGKKLPKE